MKLSYRKGSVWSYVASGLGAVLLLRVCSVHAQEPEEPPVAPEVLMQTLGGPTLVTLEGKEIPLKVAVEKLCIAANINANGVIRQEDAARPVTVKWHNTPFWMAARDLELQTDLRWTLFSPPIESAGLRLIPIQDISAQELNSQTGIAGLDAGGNALAMVVAKGIWRDATRSVQPNTYGAPVAGPDNTDSLRLQVVAYFDPKVRLLFLSPGVSVSVPEGVMGKRKVYKEEGAYGANPTLYPAKLSVPLGQAGAGTRIPLIQGQFSAYAITQTDRWELPNVVTTKPVTHPAGGGTITIEGTKLDGDKLTISFSSKMARRNVLANSDGYFDIQLLDGEGRVVPQSNFTADLNYNDVEITRAGGFTYSLRMPSKDFPEGEVRPGPFTFVWKIPTELKRVTVPFELHDVPVP